MQIDDLSAATPTASALQLTKVFSFMFMIEKLVFHHEHLKGLRAYDIWKNVKNRSKKDIFINKFTVSTSQLYWN